MRPPRLILLLLCFIFLPIFLTTLSLISAHPKRGASSDTVQGRASRLKALFSFHAPSSLFPPSAIISLTDDNSTFFLARPAAFGPVLPSNGLSGQLWIGSGFGDDSLRKGGVSIGAEGELGCSDVPGWDEGDNEPSIARAKERVPVSKAQTGSEGDVAFDARRRRKRSNASTSDLTDSGKRTDSGPTEGDGTDDHLHHPLPDSGSPQASDLKTPNNTPDKNKAHADIQSLQESAEIAGKVVLLSRGGCGFLEKVKWVQRRGGTALIVGDDTRGGGLVTMYARGDTSNVTIPAIFTSHTTAHLLSSLIPPESEEGQSDDQSTEKSGDKSGKNTNYNGKKPTNTKLSHKPTPTSRTKTTPTPTPTEGWFRSFLSYVGLWGDNAWHIHEDSRRPPSSGNLDWVSPNEWDDDEVPTETKKTSGQNGSRKETVETPVRSPASEPESRPENGDDFVIGVQDWRDPDLVPGNKNDKSAKPTSTPTPASSNAKGADERVTDDKGYGSDSNGLKGGSITPGSGEYDNTDKSSAGKGLLSGFGAKSPVNPTSDKAKQNEHWWSHPFGLGKVDDSDKPSSEDKVDALKNGKTKQPSIAALKSSIENGKKPEHEGLWVTLTPTSMSTSPFFDTLLVLVVSPLVTLTVVYALLLLRSRIRRRRWRAPKAVVDRLPVRTYHTMPSTSPSLNSPQTGTPRSSSPSSPLLSHSHSQHQNSRSRPRSRTTSDVVGASSNSVEAGGDSYVNNTEKSSPPGSTLWRRRYTGRQVECVVCLEEYIDGQSRVMSLPCGHEFHVECITPWLTTRRRTCPICKGDVVRSMGHRTSGHSEQPERMSDDIQARIAETRNDSPSAAAPLAEVTDDADSDLERGDDSSSPLLSDSQNSSSQPSWRNLASLSLSALSGDSMWRPSRPTRSDRNR